MTHFYHLTQISRNKKVGPIPVTTSSTSTCPSACPLKNNGCYAESGPLRRHWQQVSDGRRGGAFDDLCNDLHNLRRHALVRLWQAGDYPGDGESLDARSMGMLIAAGENKQFFGYTHYDVLQNPHNALLVKTANREGVTTNLSANNLTHADALVAADVGPVVTVLPIDAPRTQRTPNGHLVAVCPAEYHDIDCASCRICAVPHRKTIIGFRAHGTGKQKAQKVFMLQQTA